MNNPPVEPCIMPGPVAPATKKLIHLYRSDLRYRLSRVQLPVFVSQGTGLVRGWGDDD
ncbi:MAG: hypothetical protein AAGA83_20850 [Cyanobacteria bacterium P01_F01_bin.116]